MIFRNENQELVWLSKYDFHSDKLFYQKIFSLKYPFTKLLEKKSYTNNLIEQSIRNESSENKNN
jgi:hypothetical protein